MRHSNTSTTSALLSNMNAVFDGTAEIKAEHLGNSRAMNIGASLAGGYAAVAAGAGVAVMDDASTVKAEVDSSDLKAKSSTNGKNISVLAKNENNWKNTLVTASAAVGLGAGLAANVGINNTTGETAALVTNSQLEAENVTVKAADKLVADATGGVGAAGVGGVGVSVALNNINSSVSAHVSGGSVKAAKDIAVKAEEERHFESSVTGAAVGGIGVGVNVAVTSVGKGITQAQLSNAKDENGNTTSVNNTTQNEINIHLNGSQGVNNAKGALGVDGAKFFGLSDKDSDLNAAKNAQVSLDVPKAKSDKQGVHTGVNRALLTAAENVNVTAQETNDITAKNVTVNVGGTAVGVTDAIIHTNYDTDVTVSGATITGKEINISALQGQKNNGSEIMVTAVSVGAGLGVGVGYAGIVNKGATDVNITGSTIEGTENVMVKAQDDSKSKTQITNVGVAALNVTTTFASVENKNNVGVTLAGTNNISAAKNITIDAKRANMLEAHTQGVGVGGVNVAVNHATIEDGEKDDKGKIIAGNATAKITGTTNIKGLDDNTSAAKFHFGAANDTTAKLSAGNTAVSILGVSRMRGKGVMNMGAEVSVAGGSFNAKTVEFTSQLGTANGRTLEGNVKGHNVSAVAVAPDAVVLNTDAKSTINVANSTFDKETNLILDNKSYVDRKAYIYGVTAGAVAVGNTSADIVGNETMSTILTGKNETTKLNSLQVMSNGQNIGKAFADAGGGGIVGYVGAHVDNKSTNKVTSSLSGKWEVADEVSLSASQNDEVRLTASEGHGGIAGVGGTSVDNTIDTTTNANVADGTVINADRVRIGTSNAVTTGAYDDTDSKGNKDEQTYTLKDHFGGVISGNRLRSLLDVTENGTVNIGKDAKITTNNLQEYVASSQNNLTNLVQAKGGGAIAVTDAVSDIDIDVNNKVNVAGGATLSNEKAASAEDIILAAYDNQTIKSHVDGTVYAGVVSPIVAKNNIDMNRKSDVTVAGNIASSANVGLYAGANKSGALSNLNADFKSGAYNYSVISITVPRVKYDITADKGMVNVSGIVRSTKDINVIASGGKEEIVKDESLWNWAKGGSSTDKKFLTSDAVSAEESLPKLSTVNVTGSLIAGTADPINLTISGSVAGGLHYTADNNITNQRLVQGITKGTFDYANTLGERLRELNKLIAAYNGDSTKMAAYIAERDRIQSEMVRLGLTEKDEKGNTVYLSSGRSVYYVEIPDIATSGGNINVQANDLTGTGNLHANSAPSVTITNASDAYLKLNNILMGEQGGSIIYNKDNVIPPGAMLGNEKINSVNVHKTGAAFKEIYGRTDSTAAGLTVQNTKTFSGDKTSTISLTPELEQEINNNTEMTSEEKTKYKKAIENGEMKYTAITDVEVNGKISNFYGNVTISNASGDIRISGGTKERPTGIEGNTVKLIAANGTIAQDYKEGIVNINGDPEKYLADKATAMKNTLGLSDTNNDKKNKEEDYTRSDSSNVATGYIAGRDVYVSAANINVNGLIQSGYKTYAATVTEDQLTTAKTRPASRAAVVQNRTMYEVNDGGAKWNSTDKVFDYVPQVYWDPSTNKLVVEDIDTQGGKVYLTGKIASTGDGRILAADGAAEISVINQTNLDMNVGNVLNNQREGVITIADTAKDTWTEYKRGQTRTIDNYATYLKNHAVDTDVYAGAVKTSNNLAVGNNNTLQYAVQGNQAYTWVNGNSVETTRTYQHYERRGMWGLVQTADESTLNGWTQNSTPIDKKEGARLGLPEGAVITQSNGVPASGKLHLDGNTSVLSERSFDHNHWVTRSGFLGWFKHIYDRWKVGTSTIQLYNYSLNASQPIMIGLIGAETGKIDIKSTNATGGNINLMGNVANSHNQAALTVSSQAGGIFQNDGTTLKSEIVNLTAKNDIKNIHITSIGVKDANGHVTDNIKLDAVSTGAGDIDITAVGGLLNNQSLPGNVEIVALKSQDGNAAFKKDAALGDVALNAAGNITQSGSGTSVEGRGIYLTSANGGIGTETQAINLAASDLVYSTDRYGAQVNADAKGSIYLTETADGGDMRVGRIESQEGDVKLTVADGGFVDALPGDDRSRFTESVDNMVHRWIDAGLIDGEKDAQGNYTYKGAYIEGLEKNRDDYKANVELAYTNKTKAQWQVEYENQQAAVKGIYDSAEYRNYLSNKAKYDQLTPDERRELADNKDSAFLAYAESAEKYNQYSSYETAEAYLKDTAAYKYSQHDNADAYLAADATYQDLVNKAAHPTFEWTKDMMLYAVSDKIVNPDGGGSLQTDRAANILGKNVTLSATKGAVGTFANQSKTITVDELIGNDNIAKMKELMNVDASDVTAHRDADGNLLSFEIKGNMPLGVKASGTLDVTAGGNISVAGRKDAAGEHSAINVGTIDATQNSATGDVRLHSEEGIYNAKTADVTNITGNNLILTGGKESIGTADKPLNVSLIGDLTEARAQKNVFIKNMNNNDYLRLGTMFAEDTISLNSDKGFLMSNANADIAASYINAGKTLAFNTNVNTGIVGDADNAIRVLNNRAAVNIAAESAHIKGIQNGTLVLGDIKTVGEFTAVSEGSLTVGREEEKDNAGTVKKEAVAGAITAGGHVNLEAADSLTLDGNVKAEGKNLTLKAVNGDIAQTDKGAIIADKVKTFNGKSLLLENEENAFNSIEVDSIETTAAEKPDIAGNVRIVDNADALTTAVKRKVAGDISIINLRDSGTLTNAGNFIATGDIALNAKGDLSQAADTTIAAGKDVALTSVGDAIRQAADAGIQAVNITATSAKTVDLQGTGNQFEAITVQSSVADAGINGSVLVKDSADKLALSVQPVVNGNIAVENLKAQGTLQVLSDLQAAGDEAAAKGDITLKSDGSMQTDKKITAANNVAFTSTTGNVSINGDITTGGNMPDMNEETLALEGPHNSLVIHAGGAVDEAAGVNITAPVVESYSGNGVSLESVKNGFVVFLADALEGNTAINGSVKAVTSCDDTFTVGVGASIRGDAEFTNLHQNGELGILIKEPDDNDKEIKLLGGNGAKGNLVLTASQDVMLLGNVNAKHDIVIDSNKGGSFYGLGRGMVAGNDVNVSVGNAIQFIGTIEAGHDIDMQVQKPIFEESGIRIANLSSGTSLLTAGNEARFNVNGDGDIEMWGKVEATKDVNINISGKGNIDIDNSIQSKDESVSVQTGEGDISIGTDNVTDDETIKAKQNVTVGTNLGTVYILGQTITQDGDITMKAGKETYEEGTAHSNFIIKDDGKLVSGGGIGLYGRNGDIEITDDIQATKGITVNIAEQGNASFGRELSVTENVDISTDKGSITVGHTVNSDEGTVNLHSGNGDIEVLKAVTAGKDIDVTTVQGNILIGDNGPDVPTVTAKQNATVGTGLGIVTIYGKTSADLEDVTLYAGAAQYNSDEHTIIIEQNGMVEAGRDVNLGALNDDILVTDRIHAGRDVNAAVTGKGRIFFPGDEVKSEKEVYISLENGDLCLNLADGKKVTLRMENNSDISYVGEIKANANGTMEADIDLTGNYIRIGSIAKKNGDSTFQISAIGANGERYIAEEFSVDRLSSATGSWMPTLWSKNGYVHIDEGSFKASDLLAGNKIHLDNAQTDVAIYGRTPTRDGEQLVYWNNLDWAYRKARVFNLYEDGRLRTSRTVLIDAGKNLTKLYGDNLSVVDMMRERVTNTHGNFTFDSKLLTEPGSTLREQVFFEMEPAAAIRQQQAGYGEILVEKKDGKEET